MAEGLKGMAREIRGDPRQRRNATTLSSNFIAIGDDGGLEIIDGEITIDLKDTDPHLGLDGPGLYVLDHFVLNTGDTMTGGLTIDDTGLVVTAGGVDINADGMTVAGGVTVEDTGLTVDAGGVTVTLGGLLVSADDSHIRADNAKLTFGAADADSWILFDGTDLLLTSTRGVQIGPKAMFTPEGGFAILLQNETGANSIKGTVIEADTATDDAFVVTGTEEFGWLGIVYEDGVSDGSDCWVVVSGIAEVLLEDDPASTAATRGNWVKTSDNQGGRADATNLFPPAPGAIARLDEHFRELGHCIQSAAGGTDVLARILMHLN